MRRLRELRIKFRECGDNEIEDLRFHIKLDSVARKIELATRSRLATPSTTFSQMSSTSIANTSLNILNKTAKEFGLKTLAHERKKFSAKFAEWQEEVKSQFTQLLEGISQSP